MLPALVASGAEFEVTIEASGCGIFGQVVETLPDGFSYIGCLSCTTDDIGVDQAGSMVKFTFLGDSASFTYRVRAPTIDITTTYTFHGIVKDENKNGYPIEDNDIVVTAGGSHSETYTLTMVVDGNGSTTPSLGSHTYDAGDVVNIRATADSGWQFDGWGGDVARPSSSHTTVTMDADRTVTAHFIEIPPGVYALTVTCEPSGGGNVILSPMAGNNHYEAGTSVELTATPFEGYAFASWSGDLSGSTNPASINMDSGKDVTANFVLSLVSEGSASFSTSHLSISPEMIQPNQQVDISISIVNNGEKTGSYEAGLYINEQIESSQTVSISPGSSQTMRFSITKATPGAYSVLLGGQQGQFTVMNGQPTTVDNQSTGGGLGIATTVAIVVIAALIAALVFILRKIKKRA